MPQMGKLTLKEAFCVMSVLRLHFQANASSYSSDTEKILGVAAMLSGDAVRNPLYDISAKNHSLDLEVEASFISGLAKLPINEKLIGSAV
ncbi:hypothetical protein DSO57_1004207 [Entomophthora muscae]|uniref:Uncharacterized protein n=1 Tax=Entomophthora muscae TaxID=34485 RepID=A0ACC2RN36_9FUNG|nr:hypothetical protein DSO57_1004207 [Entomophthora muscae]